MAFGLKLDDYEWSRLIGGYRVGYDPRGALRALHRGRGVKAAWKELWNELHHQNDVDTASYAAVPWLVKIHEERGVPDWNTYGLLVTIELARDNGRNPKIPKYLRGAYSAAWKRLVEIGLVEFKAAKAETLVSCIIAALAIGKGHRELGRIAVDYGEDERAEIFEAGLRALAPEEPVFN